MSIMSVALPTGMVDIDRPLKGGLFSGLSVLFGSEEIHVISHFLVVKAQIPKGEGGLGSPSIFIDGGNVFDPYMVSEVARRQGILPENALKGIHVSRAFTCYQLVSLITEKLEPVLERTSATE